MWSDRSSRSWDVRNLPWLQISLTHNWPFLLGQSALGDVKIEGVTVWDPIRPDSKCLIQPVRTFTTYLAPVRSDTRVSLSSKSTISRVLVLFPRALIENHRGSTKTNGWSCPLSWGQPYPLAGIGPIYPRQICGAISGKAMVKRFAYARSLQEVSIFIWTLSCNMIS